MGEIDGLFDKILTTIYKLIDKQLQNLKSADEQATVVCLTMSSVL